MKPRGKGGKRRGVREAGRKREVLVSQAVMFALLGCGGRFLVRYPYFVGFCKTKKKKKKSCPLGQSGTLICCLCAWAGLGWAGWVMSVWCSTHVSCMQSCSKLCRDRHTTQIHIYTHKHVMPREGQIWLLFYFILFSMIIILATTGRLLPHSFPGPLEAR